jgi:hypothetical protein
MSIESGIYSRLTTDSAIAAIVSTRVYPGRIPQNSAMPCLTYQMISGPRDYTHDGATKRVDSRWQITVHAATYLAAAALSKLVRLRLSGVTGTWDGTMVTGCLLLDEGDIYDVDAESEAISRSGKRLDFRIYYTDAAS